MKDNFMGAAKELIAFAYVHEDYQKTGDITKGLMPLFAPIIHKMTGSVFNATDFAKAVQSKYDIPMRPIIAESLVPSLVDSGLLIKEEKSKYVAVYRCVAGPTEQRTAKNEQLEEVLKEFCAFAEEALLKQHLTIDEETLKTCFLERLKNIDFLHMLNGAAQYCQVKPNTVPNSGPQADPLSDQLSHALDILSAEYVTMLTEKDPPKFDFLVEIASGAMIADVVLTIQQPSSDTNLGSLTVALDGPLIMDMLDLNTLASKSFAEDLMELLKKANVTLITFEHVVEEMRGSIYAPLKAYIDGQDAFGPLGMRLRQDPAHATYARAVLDGIKDFMENLGISIIDSLDFEGEAYTKHCSEEEEDSLRNCLGPLHEAVERRIRDAKSIASVMRMRQGHKSVASITESKVVFVTRNVQVAGRSTECLLSNKSIGYDDVPPCILDRQLAGVLWFCLGGSINKLTREKLIANCMDALYPRPNLLATVHGFLEKLDPEKARIFQALMRDKRAQRCLLHKTFGYTHAVTQDNVEELLEEIRRSTAQEIELEAQQKTKNLQEEHERQIGEKAAELNRVREDKEQLLKKKTELETKQDEIIIGALERACKSARKVERQRKTIVLVSYVLAVAVVTFLSGRAVGSWVYVLCGLVAVTGFWFVPEKLFKSWIDKAWHEKLSTDIKASKIEEWDKRFHIDRGSCTAKKIAE
jgi:hypothetical protein